MYECDGTRFSASDRKSCGRVIANFAVQHYRAARTFAAQAAAIESNNANSPYGPFFEGTGRTYVSAALLSSAAALEAFINEAFLHDGGPLRTQINNFDTYFWGTNAKKGVEWKRVLDKYNEALRILQMPAFKKSGKAYSDADCLIGFRNVLVHFKPQWDPPRNDVKRLVRRLNGRFALS